MWMEHETWAIRRVFVLQAVPSACSRFTRDWRFGGRWPPLMQMQESLCQELPWIYYFILLQLADGLFKKCAFVMLASQKGRLGDQNFSFTVKELVFGLGLGLGLILGMSFELKYSLFQFQNTWNFLCHFCHTTLSVGWQLVLLFLMEWKEWCLDHCWTEKIRVYTKRASRIQLLSFGGNSKFWLKLLRVFNIF